MTSKSGGEAREEDLRVLRRRPADCGVPIDATFQEKAGDTEMRAPTRAGGAEDIEERVLALHTEMCEESEVTSVQEGHDVERRCGATSSRIRFQLW